MIHIELLEVDEPLGKLTTLRGNQALINKELGILFKNIIKSKYYTQEELATILIEFGKILQTKSKTPIMRGPEIF